MAKIFTVTAFSRYLQDGFGFLRSGDSSYLAGPDDIYVIAEPDQALQPANR